MTFRLALTNVNPDATEQTISAYIKDKDSTIEHSSVEDNSTEGWPTKRFIVTFQQSDFTKVTSADFWPEAIFFRQWFAAKPKMRSTTTDHGK